MCAIKENTCVKYCERIFHFWTWPIFSTSPQRGIAQKKCYHVNVFSNSENDKFSQHRPREVLQKLLPCERISSFKMANFVNIVPSSPTQNAFQKGKTTIFINIVPKRWSQKNATMWTYFETISPFWKWPISSTSPPRSDAMSNTFSYGFFINS